MPPNRIIIQHLRSVKISRCLLHSLIRLKRTLLPDPSLRFLPKMSHLLLALLQPLIRPIIDFRSLPPFLLSYASQIRVLLKRILLALNFAEMRILPMNTSLPQIFLLLNNFINLLRLDLLIFILLELHHISIELIEAPNRYKVVDLREERALLILSEQQVLLV